MFNFFKKKKQKKYQLNYRIYNLILVSPPYSTEKQCTNFFKHYYNYQLMLSYMTLIVDIYIKINNIL